MSTVQAMYDVTEQLYQLVDKPLADRDELIARVEELLQQRQVLLSRLQPPFNEVEQQLGQQIVQWNVTIDAFLNKLQEDIQKDMNGLKKKKHSMGKYTNPYASTQTDGVFYDKKN
ncbi:flagellar protein FliT [Bacillus sp. REN10]|uniref:flagellar protein FliT n=1 Tax=Bacillus sp. REN10 TaxID=2782541 RepID=UPI00193B8D9A|nr:flagellar protein FliT [Bacillus sp. REN10]